MKRLFLFMFLLACVGSLRAQDSCIFFSELGADENCSELSPFAYFQATFCEWAIKPDQDVRIPITNDPVQFWSTSVTYSGYHVHLANSLNDSLRPQVQVAPAKGNTDQLGCISTNVSMPGFSGEYYLFAAGDTGGQRRMTLAAHWVKPSGLSIGSQLVPLTQTYAMEPFRNHYDGFHQLQPHASVGYRCTADSPCNMFVLDHSQVKFAGVAQKFFTDSLGQQLSLARCSLPEGGVADNDLGANLSGVFGNWYRSVRSDFEFHSLGDECDVLNPSFPNDRLLNVKFAQLLNAAEMNGCSLGQTSPDGLTPVDTNYWMQQQNVHLICGLAVEDFLPPFYKM